TDWDRAYRLIDVLDETARELGWSLPQVVILWLLDRPGVDGIAIAAREFEHLIEDLDAADLSLPDDARRRITEASQLPAYYPVWHRLLNGMDRPDPADQAFFEEQRANVLGE
ncbi:MAG: aldo/keto reductase, partial [Kocuria sp.]|nr:aldo/keto reductase [Kocuria sp.]